MSIQKYFILVIYSTKPYYNKSQWLGSELHMDCRMALEFQIKCRKRAGREKPVSLTYGSL